MLLNLPIIPIFILFYILIFSFPLAKNQSSYIYKLHNSSSITLYTHAIYCVENFYSLFIE